MRTTIQKLSVWTLALNLVFFCSLPASAAAENPTPKTTASLVSSQPTLKPSPSTSTAPEPSAIPVTPAPTAEALPAPPTLSASPAVPSSEPPLEPTLQTEFPDAAFRSYIKELLGNTALPDNTAMTDEYKTRLSQIIEFPELALSGRGICDLSGLQYFPNLQVLFCSQNNLTALNLSAVPNLTYLNCHANRLTTLDVSMLPNLENLVCSENQLTQLDLSHNPKLLKSTCESNRLRSLDLSGNPHLTGFHCAQNQLEVLNISNNEQLTDLTCSYNQLKSLDVSNNPNLMELYCNDNQLSSLDISQNIMLRYFSCSNNRLTTLDASHQTELWNLWADNNGLSSLLLNKEAGLFMLTCNANSLAELDLSNVKEGQETEYLYQKIILPMQESEKGCLLKLPVSDPAKVSVPEEKGISYDPSTGIVWLAEPSTFKYILDTGNKSRPLKVKVIPSTNTVPEEPEFVIDQQTQTIDIDVTVLADTSIPARAQFIAAGEDMELQQINGMKSIPIRQLTDQQKTKILLWKDLRSMQPVCPPLHLS